MRRTSGRFAAKSAGVGSVRWQQRNRTGQLLDELFRNFHSIKGLSAMVSVGEAEVLAHQLETYLGDLRKGRLGLSANGFEAMIAGVKMLDHILAARRDHATSPDSEPVLADLKAILQEQPAPATTNPEPLRQELKATPQTEKLETPIAARLKPGSQAWHFTFVPSPALAERGVNVNSVRNRLQEIGEILHAAPQVLPGGQISFSFIVGTAELENTVQELVQEGLSVSRFAAAAAAEKKSDLSSAVSRPERKAIPPLAAGNVVRVDLGRLDDLMQKVGDLVLSRAAARGKRTPPARSDSSVRMAFFAGNQPGDGAAIA